LPAGQFGGTFDAIIDASTGAGLPSLATELIEPGGRIGYIGLSSEPSLIDTRALVLKDVTATGVLSASGGLAETIALYADGAVDPEPIVAATVGLDDAARVLSGRRPAEWGDAPKVHIDPRN
jgi:threonine dehydrogenase-like Zn-dependent dehydrogenase